MSSVPRDPGLDAAAAAASPTGPTARARRVAARDGRRNAMLLVGATVLGAIVVLCLGAPLFARYDPLQQDPAIAFQGMSGAHWFGTDDLGRDLFARVLYGGRISLLVAGASALVALVLGTAWGFVAATRPGVGDELLMRSADTVMAIPQILFALICVAAFGASPVNLALIIGVLLAPVTARMARSVALTEISRDYYAAAIAYGASRPRLLIRELLPNAAPAIAVQAAINAANAILLEAALSFVGLGIQPPDASWGTLLQQGYQFLYQSNPYVLFPGVAILLTIWMLNVVADQLSGGSR
jgi:ABC-type dipeptide/oligopeptide/nickel transport system permease subunit